MARMSSVHVAAVIKAVGAEGTTAHTLVVKGIPNVLREKAKLTMSSYRGCFL